MTEDEKAACIARLIQEYSATKEEIARLREHLAEDGRRLERLGEQLQRNPWASKSARTKELIFNFERMGRPSPEGCPQSIPKTSGEASSSCGRRWTKRRGWRSAFKMPDSETCSGTSQ